MAGPKPQSGKQWCVPSSWSVRPGVSSDGSERSLADLSEFDESDFDGERTEYTDIPASLSADRKARKEEEEEEKEGRGRSRPRRAQYI